MAFAYQCMLLCAVASLVRPDRQPSLMDSLPDYASLCPYSVCNSTQSKNLQTQDVTSCCQRCSCALDCYKVANCCPDVPLSKSSQPEYPCVDIAYHLNDHRLARYTQSSFYYRVVDKCPDQKRAQAFLACQHPVSLQDLVPVSDKMYERVYRNLHCARCHGVKEYIYWNISAECRDIASLSFETFEERDEYILRNCAIMAYHPEPKMADMSRCYRDKEIVSSCNITKEWNYYNRGLENACQSKHVLYRTVYTYFGEDNKPWYFNNVYCLLCNKRNDFNRSLKCIKQDIYREEEKGISVSFSALIRFWPPDTLKGAEPCRSMEIWDPFDAVCRRLHCPRGTIPVFGHCHRNLVYYNGYTISMVFELKVTTPKHSEYHPFMAVILQQLNEKVTNKLGLMFRCGRCNAFSFHYKNETNVYIEIGYFTKINCSLQYLTTKFQELVLREKLVFTMTTTDGSIGIILKTVLRKMDKDERNYIYTTRSPGLKMCFSATQLDIYTMQFCPQVELPKYEWDMSYLNQGRLKSLIENTGVIVPKNETVLVCLENYILLRESMKEGNGCTQSRRNGLSVFILHVIVSIFTCIYM